MFLGVLFALAVASVPLAGGRLGALADLRLRGVWAIAAALAVQVLIITVLPGGHPALHKAIHLSTYLLAATFAWLNRRVPGVAAAALGGALNFAAIAANGGVMPASSWAMRVAGFADPAHRFVNSGHVAHARLQVLGDVFALPASWPVHNVFSVGDIVLFIGVTVLLHVTCASRLVPRRFAVARVPAAA
jgi:uncharacterized protein DUF5317